MNSSRNKQEPSSLPPSEQAVACRSSTIIADESSGLSSTATIVALFALLEGLASNVLSRDVWLLSVYQAKDTAMQAGVTEQEFDEVMKRFRKIQESRRMGNPMHSMF